MTDLFIAQTKNSPMIQLNNEQGIITIRGNSIPEDASSLYDPLLEWVKEYSMNAGNTTVVMDIPYYNSSTSRIFHTFFKSLSQIRTRGFEVVVNWYYDSDDEDCMEAANVYSSLTRIPFTLVERS
jgi:hypothetical protein